MTTLCSVRGAVRHYGAVRALDGVDLEFARGEIVGVVGPNGSGKTTLFNCISGHTRLTKGSIHWQGKDVTRWPMHRVAASGLIRTFQQSMHFPSATVRGNVEIALDIARGVKAQAAEVEIPDDVDGLLDFVGITAIADEPSVVLGHGRLRALGVAMALASRPAMLLLDEPAAGLNQEESADLAACIRRISAAGVTVTVVDHDMGFVLPLVERLVVLSTGEKLADGKPSEVCAEPAVIEAYLGAGFQQLREGRS